MPFTHRSTLINILQGTGKETVTSRVGSSFDHWYDLDLVLGILRGFDESTQVKIGECVPRNSRFPSRADSFDFAIRNLNRAYKLNHLGGDIGDYEVATVGKDKLTITCNNPYPFYFNLGLIRGIAKRFDRQVELNTVTDLHGGKFEVALLPSFPSQNT